MDYIAEHKKMYNYLIENFSYNDLKFIFFPYVKRKYLKENRFCVFGDCFLCEYAYNLRDKDKSHCESCKYCPLSISCMDNKSLYRYISNKFHKLYCDFKKYGYCNKEDIDEYLFLLKRMRDLDG